MCRYITNRKLVLPVKYMLRSGIDDLVKDLDQVGSLLGNSAMGNVRIAKCWMIMRQGSRGGLLVVEDLVEYHKKR